MRGLQERGHTVHCITNAWNDGEFHRRLDKASISYRSVSLGAISASLKPKYLWWTLNALFHLPKAYLDFWRELRRFSPDVMLFSGARSLSTILPLVDLKKAALHVHEVPGKSRHFQRVKNANMNGGCQAYVAVSHFIGECLKEEDIPLSRIHVVQNGIEDRKWMAQQKSSSSSEKVSVGIVGQVEEWKGHDDFIRALSILKKKSIPFTVHVFGSGDESYTNHLKKEIEKERFSQCVKWHGFVTDISEIYSTLDVCVVPSRSEDPFPTTALEAGASGLPVIATKRGGLPEIIDHERTGFLVDAEAPEQIAERLEQLIRSPGLRKRMGRAARRRVQSTFSRMQMLDGVEGVLASVANNHVGPKA